MTEPLATFEQPALSPSGAYRLVARRADDEAAQFFEIRDAADDAPLYTCPDRFPLRDVLFLLWDADERVWVYSGDVGTYFWERSADPHVWVKQAYAASNVSAPPFLRQKRPRWITR